MKNNMYSKNRLSSRSFATIFSFALMLLTLNFAGLNSAKAQTIANYSFARTTSSYVPLPAPTTIVSGTWDDGTFGSLAIPFNFTYHGTVYTTVFGDYNGYIKLGASTTNSYCGPRTSGIVNVITGAGVDLVSNGTSSISYQTLGTTPSRQFVVQWTNCHHYGGPSGDNWNFQIILNETSNSVEIVYGTCTQATTQNATACQDANTDALSVGLVGATNADFNLRNVVNGTTTWATSTAGAAITAACQMSPTNVPASGLTYVWTPPPTSTICTPSTSSYACVYMWINNVTTAGGVTNINNTSTCAATSYTNFSPIDASANIGNTVTITCNSTGYGLAYNVYIDYNNNGVFTDAGELVCQMTTSSAGAISGTFTVPSGKQIGNYRMRVRGEYYGSGYPGGPCTTLTYGETEDYLFTVLSSPPPTITSYVPTSACIGNVITVKGTKFTGLSSVKFFNNITATFTFLNDSTFTCTVPVGATTGAMTIISTAGTATGASFTINGTAPTVTCPTIANQIAAGNICQSGNVSFAGTTTAGTLSYTLNSNTITSPAVFPVGVNTVIETGTSNGCSNTCSFTVTVIDNTPPVMVGCPTNINIGCPGVYTFTSPTATDACGGLQASSITFNYTGGVQTWTVPSGASSVTANIFGAQGGVGYSTSPGGLGGKLVATYPVSAGQQYLIFVGGAGNAFASISANAVGGFNGGGGGSACWSYYAGTGGGASDIRFGGNALTNRILVAGGGGGGGYYCGGSTADVGGNGGGTTGADGWTCSSQNYSTHYSGYGGTPTAGGQGGNSNYCAAEVGALGVGGQSCYYYGGTGGGGYYGGGGGYAGGGGGGSSFAFGSATTVVHTQGAQTGNGIVILNYNVSVSNPLVTQIAGLSSGSNFPSGVTTNTFRATDPSGNTATCSFTVTSSDNVPPTIVNCPTSITLPCPGAYNYTSPTVTDNCSSLTTSGVFTFNYTGGAQTWLVPGGVTSITVDLAGAQGGNGQTGTGGNGGRLQSTLSVTSGQTLNIYVGGAGGNSNNVGGFNGGGTSVGSSYSTYIGGGGGATDIRAGGTALANRIAVAGGGGAGGYNGCTENGGAGGGLIGVSSTIGCATTQSGGGTQLLGGAGGTYSGYTSGSNGTLGVGGGGSTSTGGASGGGGYFGGGGGAWLGGGGGSSYSNGTNVTHTQGFRASNGYAIISYTVTFPNIIQTLGLPSGSNFPNGSTSNVFVATDGAGNTSSCAFTVLINDVTPPTITGCPTSQSGICPGIVTFANPTVTDNCGGARSFTQTYTYTGLLQTFTVPAGVSAIAMTAQGAAGGNAYNGYGAGGAGGSAQGTISVSTGQVLNIFVGGLGGNAPQNSTVVPGGFNGGGAGSNYYGAAGGGASDIRIGGNALSNRVIVGGGGGGGAYDCGTTNYQNGGSGGATTALLGAGYDCNTQGNTNCGMGAFSSTAGVSSTNTSYCTLLNATLGVGADACSANYGAGGGGGYYGGGAGVYGGAGGGSNYTTGLSAVTNITGANAGSGLVIINYTTNYPIIAQTSGLPSGGNYPVGNTTDVFTATDFAGNTSTCSFTISTSDNIPPTIVGCPSNIVGGCPGTFNFTTPTVTDNCGTAAFVGSQTFSYTGAAQTFTVPGGVTAINADVRGAKGGTNPQNSAGGLGGRTQATLPVLGGQILNIFVGGTTTTTTGGFNGGGTGGNASYSVGGGGASDIRTNGTALANRMIVAGGGAGAGYNCGTSQEMGGAGGGLVGETGYQCNTQTSYPGTGGTQNAGGTSQGGLGTTGTIGVGGNGYNPYGGGGGGGYFGGGGASYGGGGGGSNYTDISTSNITHTQGFQSGNGVVILNWIQNYPTIVQIAGLASGSSYPQGTTTNVFQAIDGGGNTSSCSFTVTISDNTPPVISNCPTNILSGCPGIISFTTPTVTDNCGGSVNFVQTYTYTGTSQVFTVPAGVTSVTMDVQGAKGGNGYNGYGTGGSGGRAQGTKTVSTGQVLIINVGGVGVNATLNSTTAAGGFNGGGAGGNYYGGGGGGQSDIRIDGSAFTNCVIIGAGGGGGNYNCGTTDNQKGGPGAASTAALGAGYYCGTQNGSGYCGTGGIATAGGTSSSVLCTLLSGTQGVGADACTTNNFGGGGGAGYWGGGAGAYGGGGGGSNYTTGLSAITNTTGYNGGTGLVVIGYTMNYPVITQTSGLPSGSNYPNGTTQNTFVATDFAGNTATCAFTVTTSDNVAPTIVGCPNNIAAGCPGVFTYTSPTVTDNCGSASFTGGATFTYTGAAQTFTVPGGVSAITAIVTGAQGGTNAQNSAGGLGGKVQASLPVLGGQVLNIFIGGTTTTITGGFNGGGNGANISYNRGAGGASDIRIGGTALSNRKIVAGGGGGAGYNCGSNQEPGGAGGGLTGASGWQCNTQGTYSTGGSQTNGGLNIGGYGTNGVLGVGGSCTSTFGGGGGGGYYGGGGASYGGGGGGSSYTDPSATAVVHTQGVQTGNGIVILNWVQNFPAIVQVSGLPSGASYPQGVTTNVFQAIDGAGNTSVCSFTVTISDNVPPTISGCPSNVTVNNAAGICSQVVTFTSPTCTDNCGGATSATVSFAYTGAAQTWTVPGGVSNVLVKVYGAQGGASYGGAPGGLGGFVQANYPVTSGQPVYVYAGGAGKLYSYISANAVGGFNGGGGGSACWSYYAGTGGGASDIRLGGNALTNRVLVAGGGGGGGYYCSGATEQGGAGGTATGEDGWTCNSQNYSTHYSGFGASQVAGGQGGNSNYCAAEVGALGVGGQSCYYYGGTGGGGYYGGGGGYAGGGGGGSNFVGGSATNVTNTRGVQGSDGLVVITYSLAYPLIAQTSGLPSGSSYPVGVTTNRFTATDFAGNTSICTFTITVNDVEAPVIATCPSNISVNVACGSPIVTWTAPTATDNCAPPLNYSNTYSYTGSIITFTVPTGVTSLQMTAIGAAGGYYTGMTPGKGASMSGTFAVSAGQVLSILVGQCPGTTTIFAAGGGGSYIALGANYTTATPLLVGGGGGGAYSGGTGTNALITTTGDGPVPGTNGNGAPSTTCGGGGGGFYSSGGNDQTYNVPGGAGFRQGGAGGIYSGYQTGGFGGGAPADYVGSCNIEGGAGGGYSGGSGMNSGGFQSYGFGAGSYNGGTNQVNTAGANALSNGTVIINYSIPSTISLNQTAGLASGSTFPLGVTTNTFVAVDQAGNSSQPCTFTVTLVNNPTPVPTGTGGSTACGSGTATLTGSGTGTLRWFANQTGGTPLFTGATFVTPSINVQTTYWLENLIGACPSVRVPVIASIGPGAAVINMTNSLPHICNGNGPSVLIASSTDTYVYTWTPTTGLNTSTGATVSANPSQVTTTYTVNGFNPNTGCHQFATTVIGVGNTPTISSITSSVTNFCLGNSSQFNIVAAVGGSNALANPVCNPGQSTYACTYMWISNVTTSGGINNFNNTSSCAGTSYTDFSGSYTVSQLPGGIVTLSLTSSGYGLAYNVYVDYNNNGNFTDGGELVLQMTSTSATVITGNFTIPSTATPGNVRMRIVGEYYGSGYASSACPTLTYGETEDYKLYIVNPSALTYSWAPGTGLSSTTITNPIVTPISAGTFNYVCTVSDAGGCTATGSLTLNVGQTATAPVTTGATRCGLGTVNLSASGSATLRWIPSNRGGQILASGNSYSPTVSATTNYFVYSDPGGTTANVGLLYNGAGTTAFASSSGNYQTFDVLSVNGIKINTVDVVPNAATPLGTPLSVSLEDSAGNVLATASTVTTSQGTVQTVSLGFYVPFGHNFQLRPSQNPNLQYHQNGFTNPYTIPAQLAITGWGPPNATTLYVFFYNWNITYGCNSLLSQVTAIVSTPPSLTVTPQVVTPSYCTSGSVPMIANGSTFVNYTWSPSAGLNTTSGATVTASPSVTTTYIVTASDINGPNGCVNTQSQTVTVNPVPYITVTPSIPSPMCTSPAFTLNGVGGSQGFRQIGTATNPQNTSALVYNGGNTSLRSQMLFTASELNAAGIYGPGNITSIGFNIAGKLSVGQFTNFTISMANTATSPPMTTYIATSMTQVYQVNYTTSLGWNTHNLTTPFNWDGSSNLLIETCFTNATNIGFDQVFCTDVASASFVGGTALGCTNTSGTASVHRPNVRFTGGSVNYSWSPGTGLSSTTVSTPTYTPSTTGNKTYTVTVTDPGTGCSASASTSFLIKSIPQNPTVTSSTQTFCGPHTATLTGSGSDSLRWYTQSTGGTPVGAGTTYQPFVTSTTTYYLEDWNGGCTQAGGRPLTTVTINAAPTFTLGTSGSGTQTKCQYASSPIYVASGASNFNSFTWSPSTGLSSTSGTTVTSSISVQTIYTVVASNSSTGCQNTAVDTIRITPAPVISVTANPNPLCDGSGHSQLTTTQGVNATVTIGTGTVQNSTTTYPAPYGQWYTGARHQMLVLASELTGQGLTAGNISSMAFNVAGVYSTQAYTNVNLYMFSTSLTALTTTFATAPSTPNYTSSGYTVTTGWNTHTFSTPFAWDGTSNVIVEFDFLDCSTCPTACTNYTNNDIMNQSTTSFASTTYTFADGNCNIETASTGTTANQRPNMQFTENAALSYSWSPSNLLNSSTIYNPITSGLSAGNNPFVVTVTSQSTGCTNTASVVVSVGTAPVVTVTPSVSSYCISNIGSIVMTASGADTYSWSPTNNLSSTTGVQVTANPTSSTSYVVTGMSIASGCTATATSRINVGDSVSLRPLASSGQGVTPPTINGSICSGNNDVLKANAYTGKKYVMDSTIAFHNIGDFYSPAPIGLSFPSDDSYRAVNLNDNAQQSTSPFVFNYYGVNYTRCYISSNGFLKFGPDSASAVTAVPQIIPNASAPNNVIALAWANLNPAAGGNVQYYSTVGDAPFRKFVVEYINVPFSSATGDGGHLTGQIVLYETTNVIELYITSFNPTLTTTYATEGIENSTGTAPAYVNLSWNANYWTTTNNAVRFSPSGGTFSYSWTPTTGLTPSPLSANVTTPNLTANGSYTVTAVDSFGCSATQTVGVTVNQLPTFTFTTTNDSCNGQSNGTITVTASGGPGLGYVYSKDNGVTYQSSNVFTGLAPATYQIKVKDTVNLNLLLCTSAATSVTITQPAVLTFTTTPLNVQCNGGNNGSITVTGSGGTTPYIYSKTGLNTFQTSNVFGTLATGNYPIGIKDNNLCTTGVTIVSITQPTAVTINTTTKTNVQTCFGNSNGGITVVGAGGGISPLSYSINSVTTYQTGTGANVFGALTAGTYTVRVRDANLCVLSVSPNVTLTQPQQVVISPILTSVTNVIPCHGSNNGTITVSASGGTGTKSYSKNGGATIPNFQTNNNLFAGLTAGTYTLLVKDANGCLSAPVTKIVTQPDSVTFAYSKTDVVCYGNGNGTITITGFGGNGDYNYSIDGGSTFQSTGIFTNLGPGTYQMVVQDYNFNQCTSGIVSVTVNEPPLLTFTTVITNVSGCIGGSNAVVEIDATGGLGTLHYSIDGGVNFFTSHIFSNLFAGTYNIVVKDINNCTRTSTVVVGQPTQTTFTEGVHHDINYSNSCHGDHTGYSELVGSGGTGFYHYSNDGGNTFVSSNLFTLLAAGPYNCQIVDNNGCLSGIATIAITEPTAVGFTTTIQNANCNANSNGSILVTAGGGTGALHYSKNGGVTYQTNNQFTNLTSGVYSVVVKDGNGCTAQSSVTIGQPNSLSTNGTGSNLSCNGNHTGIIAVTVTGGTQPYSYNWNNTYITPNVTGLAAGTYTVIVTDAHTCTSQSTVTITEPNVLTVSVSETDLTCNGNNTGTVSLTVAGGTSPYYYNWNSNTYTTQNLSGISAGSYGILVSDVNGCNVSTSVVVNQPDILTAVATPYDLYCNGDYSGLVILDVIGGTSSYSFDWNSGAYNSQDLFNIPAGIYSVVVTDMNGCIAVTSTVVNEPAAILAVPSTADLTCNGNGSGTASVAVTGGSSPYYFNWNTGDTTPDISGLSAGGYEVVISDNNGCAIVVDVTINEPDVLFANAVGTDLTCNSNSSGMVSVDVIGGTMPYSYLWDNGGTDSALTSLATGSYNVVVTDFNGCETTSGVTINEPTVLSVLDTTNLDLICNGDGSGAIDIMVSGGTGGYSFNWNNGVYSTEDLVGIPAGLYTVVVSDGNNCTVTMNVTINQPDILVVSMAGVNLTCNSNQSGSVSASVTGGTTPYSYSWDNGGTDSAITGAAAGNYNVTVTDANNCVTNGTFTINEPGVLTATTSGVNLTCSGNGSGTVSANVTGGTLPYNYTWSNGSHASNQSGLQAGTYVVTVSDINNCTPSVSTVIITEPNVLSSTTNGTDLTCNGNNTGAVNVSASGGTSPYGYFWSNGATTSNQIGLSAGIYGVVVTDYNGCVSNNSFSVSEPAILATTTSGTDLTCNGSPNGTVSVNVTGGTSPYSYLWSNGATTASQNGLSVGTYGIAVTDYNGCISNNGVTISQPSTLATTTSGTDLTCNGSANGIVSVSITGGTAPFSYLWSNGATIASQSGLSSGVYGVTVTDHNGCISNNSVTISQPSTLATSTSGTNLTCNGSANGTVSVSVTGGTVPYGYLWNNGATTANQNGLSANTYGIVVTDHNGCISNNNITVTQPTVLTSIATGTNLSCNGNGTGTVSVSATGGTNPYSYSWSNGTSTSSQSGLSAGAYGVTVTDHNGCVSNSSYAVTQPVTLTASATGTNLSCNGSLNGAVSVSVSGGTNPYSYSWSNGASTSSQSGLSAGNYGVIVTDFNGCVSNSSYLVTEPNVLVANATGTNLTCNGNNTGTVGVNVTGGTVPYGYLWSNGATTANQNGLSANSYSVVVTDHNGCISNSNITVTQPIALTSTVTGTNLTCNGNSTGAVSVSASGGTSPYGYLWNNGATVASQNGLVAGSYAVTVTDHNLCVTSSTVAITQPAVLTANATGTNLSCNGSGNGTVSVGVFGGTSPYTYSWSNGATISAQNGLAATTYGVTVTDHNNCATSSSVIVSQPAVLAATATGTNLTCNGNGSGSVNVSVTGGTTLYSYSWTGPVSYASTLQNPGSLAAGTYNITVTDAHGCTAVSTTTITQTGVLTATVTGTNLTCNANNSGTVSVSVSGGLSPYTYLWNNGPTTSSQSGLAIATYSVAVSDVNHCNGISNSVTLTQPTVVTISGTTQTNVVCNGASTGAINSINASGGTGTITYSNNGNTGPFQGTNSFSGLAAATYPVMAKDANGCLSGTTNVILTQNTAITFTTAVVNVVGCFGGTNGRITVTASGGGGTSYSYSKTGAAPYQSGTLFTGLTASTYSVIVKNNLNCSTAVANVPVTQPSQVVLTVTSTTNELCNGGTIGSLTVAGSGGAVGLYKYSKNGGTPGAPATFNGLTAGTYSMQAIENGGNSCTSVVVNAPVTQPTAVTFSTANTNASNCNTNSADGTITVTAAGGTSGYYYSKNGGTSYTALINSNINAFSGLTAATYNIQVKDANNCPATVAADPLACNTPAPRKGFTGSGNDVGFTVYPNPANDHAMVEFSTDGASAYKLQLTDVIGRTLMMQEGISVIGDNQRQLDVSTLAKGVYLVSIEVNGNRTTLKLVIE